jgi:hypothetical protein
MGEFDREFAALTRNGADRSDGRGPGAAPTITMQATALQH